MTTTQYFHNHSLSVDPDEDKMEMATSPFPEPHDNDDDIDFELDDQREHSLEDNSMIDDNTKNMETNPEQDDVTFYENDDEVLDFDQDLPMEPDQSSYTHDADINDEDENQLAQPDFHDPSIEDASFEDAAAIDGITEEREDNIIGNELQEEATNIDFNTEELQSHDTSEELENDPIADTDKKSETASADGNAVETQSSDIKDFAPDGVPTENRNHGVEQPQFEENAAHEDSSTESAETEGSSERASESIEALTTQLYQSTGQAEDGVDASTNGQVQKSPQREASPVVLHPVNIRYNGEDCWLFPPLENADSRHVFLEDVTLASEPFDRLLAALRSGLVNDQEMADHDELVFDIPVLGLHICEDSKHASLMNLSRIIDIYMMLSQNEGLTVFEPLHCELSTRVCLADQFAYVDEAAFVRRITYTDFVAEQAGSPEEETEQHHEESVETGNVGVQEDESAHVDVSTYYDAADNREETTEGELLEQAFDQNDFQEIEEQTLEVTENSPSGHFNQPEEEETNTTGTTAGDEATDAQADDLRLQTNAASEVAAAVEETTDTRQGSRSSTTQQHNSPSTDLQKEDTTAQTEETNLPAEHEADEDLFANDVIESDLVKETTGVGNNTNEPESIPANDDLDFDTWSDDEHETTKTEVSPGSLTTPSKGLNGKRKLLEEEDDFLDLDIATPEPKRNRQS